MRPVQSLPAPSCWPLGKVEAEEGDQPLVVPVLAGAVVFCLGLNDTTFEDGMPRVPTEQTLDNAAALLGWSAARWPTLMLGPPPALHDAVQDARVAALSPLLEALAERFAVPFLPLHAALSHSTAWRGGAARGDGVHPDAGGYAAMAALVEAWEPWLELTGG